MKVSIDNLSDLWDILKNVVELAEGLWAGFDGAGADKRAWAVDLLNEKINIPLVPEALEGEIIGLFIDLAVSVFINS
tara:strand:- start:3026 stop:3256 length:231 start_codon:yes stop_codon:yes gene_type:complete